LILLNKTTQATAPTKKQPPGGMTNEQTKKGLNEGCCATIGKGQEVPDFHGEKAN